MYKEFLGTSQIFITFAPDSIFHFLNLKLRKVRTTFVLGVWHEENMNINYVQENPTAMLCHEHAATIRLQLEGYF